MKYLIDHRYKKLNAIRMHTLSILSTYKRGRSEEFSPQILALHEELQEIKPIKSAPLTPEEIAMAESLEKTAHEFLLLPQNLEEVGRELLEKTQLLMSKIDPFTYTLEESVGVRKSRLVELTQEIQTYIESYMIQLEGNATSIIDEKLIIQDIVSDIKRIEKNELNSKELEMIDKIIKLNIVYQKDPNLSTTQIFSELASEAEHLFRGNTTPYKNLKELIKYLLKIYNEIDTVMTSEKEGFSKFMTPLRSPLVIQSIDRLRDLKLNSKPLMTSREHLLFAYENALLEDGATFISRCRAIDFTKLFGYELRDFDDLLTDRPDKDLKIF